MSEASQPESPFLSVIRIWAALAWADGVIAPAETVALEKLIASAKITDEERKIALSWLETKVVLDTANIASMPEPARHGIYRAAAQLAAVDLEVATSERAFLVKLRDELSISAEQAKEIVAGIPGYNIGIS